MCFTFTHLHSHNNQYMIMNSHYTLTDNDQSRAGNANLTVGGLKGTGHFLSSRADDFAD